MKYYNTTANQFLKILGDRKIVLVGASGMLQNCVVENGEWMQQVCPYVKYIVDNDVAKQGSCFSALGYDYKITSFDVIKREKDIILLLTLGIKYTFEVINQFEKMNLDDSIECYSLGLLLENGIDIDQLKHNELQWGDNKDYQNEKIIHCCWFSGEKKPQKYQECIDSWKKYCADYKIIEWNSSNYDFSKNKYLREAYTNKAWAFASDYVRLDVVQRHGGIYLDMDVELLRNIDDLLKYKAFFCYEWGNYLDLGSAFGAVKNDCLIKELLAVYDDLSFIKKDGSRDRLSQPIRLRPCFEKMGIELNGCSTIVDDRVFLSMKYFSVVEGLKREELRLSQETYGVHWHNAGWYTREELEVKEEAACNRAKLRKIFMWQK